MRASHGHANDTRALAAEVLADVALHGASLRARLQPVQARLTDPRDRALLTALCNEGARWWLRFDAVLRELVRQPLHRREPTVHALLVLGLVQLEILQLPHHAAVAATVESTRVLGRGAFAQLVNAVLRRWLRERGVWVARLDAQAQTRSAHPRWLIDAIARDWPDVCDAILAANDAPTTPTLRANARRASREDVIAALAADGIAATAHPWLRDAIVLRAHADVARMRGFADGRFSVQDGAAQLAVDLLELRDGLRVLDACAAPGGKACHILERAGVRLTAVESGPARVASIGENLRRLGLDCEVRSGDAGDPRGWWDGTPFDRILLDAPCSATGVIRRHPDIKLHRRASDVARLARGQSRLLTALWPLLAPGGRLAYATCSVLRDENERIIAAFTAANPDARSDPIDLPDGHRAGAGWQFLPGDGGFDGMFYAVLRKCGRP